MLTVDETIDEAIELHKELSSKYKNGELTCILAHVQAMLTVQRVEHYIKRTN